LTPDVHIVPCDDDAARLVVTFSPPVASWLFHPEHPLDELWLELLQGSGALAMDLVGDTTIDAAETHKRMRERITTILLYWQKQGWVSFLSSPETPTES
jgi:hypothetical protein